MPLIKNYQTAVADPGFSPGGAPTLKIAIIFQSFAENCMKMKELGPGGGRTSLAPALGSANASIPKYVNQDQMLKLLLSFCI